jgi:hypothetical protein
MEVSGSAGGDVANIGMGKIEEMSAKLLTNNVPVVYVYGVGRMDLDGGKSKTRDFSGPTPSKGPRNVFPPIQIHTSIPI